MWPGWKLLAVDVHFGILVCMAGLKVVVSHLMWMDDTGMNRAWELLS